MSLNGMADITQSRAWTNGFDSLPHRLIRYSHKLLSQQRNIAYEVSFTGISDVAIFFQRDIEVHDVPVLQHLGSGGDTVADHVVTGRIQGVGISILPFAGWARVELVHNEIVHQIVDLHGRHAH